MKLPPGCVHVYANRGRWVADCYYCDDAVQLAAFTDGFRCPTCDYTTTAVWPSPEMVAGIERLLLMRPNPRTQNWLPHETLHDLLQENATHGILELHAKELPTGAVLHIAGDQIVTDALPTMNPRRELVR